MTDISWMRLGNCLGSDPDLFYPDRGESTAEAKAVCATCSVKDQCLEYALEARQKFGIWGGTSERERRRLRKARKKERGGYELRCEGCNTVFVAGHPKAMYCTHACRQAAYQLRGAA